MRRVAHVFVISISLALSVNLSSQNPAPTPSPDVPQDKPRIFITDSQSWEVAGASGGTGGTYAGSMSGGARPQTAEIVKTFGERCPRPNCPRNQASKVLWT